MKYLVAFVLGVAVLAALLFLALLWFQSMTAMK